MENAKGLESLTTFWSAQKEPKCHQTGFTGSK